MIGMDEAWTEVVVMLSKAKRRLGLVVMMDVLLISRQGVRSGCVSMIVQCRNDSVSKGDYIVF